MHTAGVSYYVQSFKSKQRETFLDRATIIAELEAERNRLDSAIAALRGNRITFRKASGKPDGRKRPPSAATRRKLSQATKRRWAEWRKKKAAARFHRPHKPLHDPGGFKRPDSAKSISRQGAA
jgi:hypothetical protein